MAVIDAVQLRARLHALARHLAKAIESLTDQLANDRLLSLWMIVFAIVVIAAVAQNSNLDATLKALSIALTACAPGWPLNSIRSTSRIRRLFSDLHSDCQNTCGWSTEALEEQIKIVRQALYAFYGR